MKTAIKKSVLLMLAGSFALTSCRKDEDPPVTDTPVGPGSLTLEVHHMMDTVAFAFNQNMVDDSGTVYQFTRAEFYVSGLKGLDHSSTPLFSPSVYHIFKPSIMNYSYGDIISSDVLVHELSFNVGIDSVTNHTDPSTYPSSSVLSPQSPNMFWSWSSGYIFVALEGLADRNADGIAETAFEMHVGMDNLLRNVLLTIHQDLKKGQANTVHLEVNWAAFFNQINLANPNSQTHTMDNMPLAMRIANNISSVFSVH